MTVTSRGLKLLHRARARRAAESARERRAQSIDAELEDAILLVCRELDAVVVSSSVQDEAA